MELAFEIEDAASEANAFKSLFLATIEAAFNSDYGAEEYEAAFNFLYGLAFEHSERLKILEKEAFKLLKESRISETALA
jgi:hypothetical protein